MHLYRKRKTKSSKEELKSICFFVDLDGTLINIVHLSCFIQFYKNEIILSNISLKDLDGIYKFAEKKEFKRVWDHVLVKKRPLVEEFLLGLSKLGRVFLCSAGKSDYVHKMIDLFDLKSYFEKVFTKEDIFSGCKNMSCSRFYLIDNFPIQHINTIGKMSFLGLIDWKDFIFSEEKKKILDRARVHLIQVNTYNPLTESEDSELSHIMYKIIKKIYTT